MDKLYFEAKRITAPYKVREEDLIRLCEAYAEPWRRYHNSDHILNMLGLLQTMDIHLSSDEKQRLEIMILYHDVWYKVGRKRGENEVRSAKWAVADLMDLNLAYTVEEKRLVRCINQGIVATIKHELAGTNGRYVEEIATLLDLDLWGLGQSPERFQEDTEKIWEEYQPILTREEFMDGRIQWAKDFLASRSQVYHTEPFFQFEDMAQENLASLAG